jgi:hypothetical protein
LTFPFVGLYGSMPGSTRATSSSKTAWTSKLRHPAVGSFQLTFWTTFFLFTSFPPAFSASSRFRLTYPSQLFVRDEFVVRAHLVLDFSSQGRHQLYIYVRLEKCRAELFEESVNDLAYQLGLDCIGSGTVADLIVDNRGP